MTERSYSHQVVEFLKKQAVGYEFTARSLYEEIVTTPGERIIPSADHVSATLTRQRRNKALDAVALTARSGGTYYRYTIVAPEKLNASYRRGYGGSKGPRKQHIDLKAQPDMLEPPMTADQEQYGAPLPPTFSVSRTTVSIGVGDTTDAISDEVKYHIRMAFRAYKRRILHPAPEIAVKSIPTDVLMDELSRRVKGMHHDEEADRQAKADKQAGS